MKYHNRQVISTRIVLKGKETKRVQEGGPRFETPYVKQLKAVQRKIAADELNARKNKVKKDNHICGLILDYLKVRGARTRGRIARDLNLTAKVITNVGKYLIRRKLIEEHKGKKGDMIYALKGQ